jgi:hypothetical protein
MAKFNPTKLKNEVKKAAAAAFEQVLAENPDEAFYAYGLYIDEAAVKVWPSMNSEEGFLRVVDRDLAYSTREDLLADKTLRYSPADWAFAKAGIEHFAPVNELLGEWRVLREDDEEKYWKHRQRVFEAMVKALAEMNKAGFFGKGKKRDEIFVIFSVAAADDLRAELAWTKRLNPAAAYKVIEDWLTPYLD